MFNRLVLVLGIFLSSSFSVFAVEPDEVVSDPVLEGVLVKYLKGYGVWFVKMKVLTKATLI